MKIINDLSLDSVHGGSNEVAKFYCNSTVSSNLFMGTKESISSIFISDSNENNKKYLIDVINNMSDEDSIAVILFNSN